VSPDLSRDLHDLAGRTAAALPGGGLDAAALARRARGRRRARTATFTVVSTAAVAVLAAGATLALRQVPDPQPAHTPSPTPTTSAVGPTPTPSATVPTVAMPAGDAALAYGTCGSLATAVPEHGFAATWRTAAELDATRVPAGDPLVLTARLDGADAASDVAFPAAGPRLSVLRDGVVVAGGTDAYGGARPGTWLDLVYSEGDDVVTYGAALPLTVCDPGGGAAVDVGAPLPAGEYTLVAWTPVAGLPDGAVTGRPDDTRTADQVVADAGAVWVVAPSAPVPFTVVGHAEAARTTPVVEPDLDALPTTHEYVTCGDPMPSGPSSETGLALRTDPVATEAAAGSTLAVSGALEARTGERWTVSVPMIDLVLSQDGVVVGSTLVPQDGWSVVLDVGLGAPVDLHHGGGGDLTTCSTDPNVAGDPLPPGTYTVHPVVHVLSAEVWTRASGTRSHDQSFDVVGTPFELTIT